MVSEPLELSKWSLAQTSTVSNQGTLSLFPVGKKSRQKFIIGDGKDPLFFGLVDMFVCFHSPVSPLDAGKVTCFEMKKGGAVESWVYQTPSGESIQALAMNLDDDKQDRVFCAQGQSIFGVSKKGKEVFRLVSPSSEVVRHLKVDGLLIYSSGDYTFQLFDNGRDAGFLMCDGKVALFTADPLTFFNG